MKDSDITIDDVLKFIDKQDKQTLTKIKLHIDIRDKCLCAETASDVRNRMADALTEEEKSLARRSLKVLAIKELRARTGGILGISECKLIIDQYMESLDQHGT